MRASKYLLSTAKETPYDAKIISHQLMIKSGMIKKISSGLYIWLPTGIRVIKKIKKIIMHEMKKINALEISMPIIQPEFLWKQSGRLDIYGEELLKFKDRRHNQFILGPTNEEMVTYFIKNEIQSYKKLPLIIYQIQTKFRDEIRPRFGVIRSREFIMKDAYSFHNNEDCLKNTYDIFYKSYINIFKKMKLNFCVVKADSGSMGGNISHEFQAFSENGEDEVVFSENQLYFSNKSTIKSTKMINIFNDYNTNEINLKTKKSTVHCKFLKIPIKNQIKTILIKIKKNNIISIIGLLIPANYEKNLFKKNQTTTIKKTFSILNEKDTILFSGVKQDFLGPIGLKIPIIGDISILKMKNFTIGSNIQNHFFTNMNWNIDLSVPTIKDIKKIIQNNFNNDSPESLKVKKSIEIGHIFQLGEKYSEKMQAFIKSKSGAVKNMQMGCYGIGITRIIAAIIEQNHDQNGIIWPSSVAPFEVVILPIKINQFNNVKDMSIFLYKNFKNNGIDVIIDDRNERAGVMFHDIDLIGIPHQILVSTKLLSDNRVEYRERKNKKITLINTKEIINFIKKKLNR